VSDSAGIVLERVGDVAILRLNRPHVLNAIDRQTRDEWISHLRDFGSEASEVRALILTGTGRAFCSGGDVNEQDQYMGPTAHDGWWGQYRYQELVRLIRELPIPVLAAVNGLALGGGMAVALMADLCIASEDAEFGVGQIERGFIPDVGLTYILPRLVGTMRAMELMMLYPRITAARGAELGFVNWVVPASEVMERALAVADRIAASPPAVIEWIKRVTYANLDSSFLGSIQLEAMAQGILATGPAFEEGREAFRRRRESK
jgi:2-(1,2-epoxy-1,2-dihydrophenyl)acetyl-CoA isomerase